MRILITGSRDWVNPFVIGAAIEQYIEDVYMNAWNDPGPIVIVFGDARGADRWAKLFAKANEYAFEEYEADWARYGKAAGPKRNQVMVDKGADVVLAFPKGKSVGTRDCIKKAREAKLHVIVIEGDEHDIP